MPRRNTAVSNPNQVQPKEDLTAAPTVVEAGESKNGKTILIEKTKCGRFFTCRFDEGGEKPRELDGIFTSFVNAQQAVTAYKTRKKLDD